jgi:cyclic pyranopterin phosphate synthase
MAMIDVSGKAEIFREATATGTIKLKPETIDLIKTAKIAKGDPLYTVSVTSTVKTKAQTGVEMEALTAVSVALLTVWDMTKQYEKDSAGQYPSTAIENIHVLRKFKQA